MPLTIGPTLVSDLVAAASSGLVQCLVGACAAEPFVPAAPNSGAVVFDGASYYNKAVSGAGADGKTASFVFWGNIVNDDVSTLLQLGFDYTSGKTTSYRTPFLATQRNSEKIRIDVSGAKSTLTLRLTVPPILDIGEFNMLGVGIDIINSLFTYVHWSETSGLTSGTITPMTNTGQDIEWSNVEDVFIGAANTITTPTEHTEATIAQMYLSKDYNDMTDTDVQALLIDASNYYNAQRLGQGLIAHSGNTSTFAANAGTLYATADVTDTALADATGPTPPFTL